MVTIKNIYLNKINKSINYLYSVITPQYGGDNRYRGMRRCILRPLLQEQRNYRTPGAENRKI